MTQSRKIRFGGRLVPYDDAEQEVTIERTNADILLAVPGDDRRCMNSVCIRAHRNLRCFPHPVYAVSTTKSRVFIVDRLDDSYEFAHCVRYELSGKDSSLISDHDKYGSGEPGLLKLRVPRDPKGSPRRAANRKNGFADGAGHGGNPGASYTGKRDRPVTGGPRNGPVARYKVAVSAGLL